MAGIIPSILTFCMPPVLNFKFCISSYKLSSTMTYQQVPKGGIEGPAGPANAVPLSEAVCNAGPLFDRSHTH